MQEITEKWEWGCNGPIRIIRTQYTLSTKSLDIYVSGCKGPHCEGCHNEKSWDFNNGDLLDLVIIDKIKYKILQFDTLINNIFILGGEPMDQNLKDLKVFLYLLRSYNKKIWLFTHYSLNKIPNEIKELIWI